MAAAISSTDQTVGRVPLARFARRRALWCALPCLFLGAMWSCQNDNPMNPPAGNNTGGIGGAGGGGNAIVDSGYVDMGPPASDWCSARKVLDENCNGCHVKGSPFGSIPLVSYEDLQAKLPSGLFAYQSVQERIHATDDRRMPPTIDQLTPYEMGTIDNWIKAGALAGSNPSCVPGADDAGSSDGAGGTGGAGGAAGSGGTAGRGGSSGAGGASDAGRDAFDASSDVSDASSDGAITDARDAGSEAGTDASPPTGWPADCEDRYTVLAHGLSQPGDKTKFNVSNAGSRDFYQCFLFKAPWANTTVQGVRFRPIIDDTRVVARWVLYGLDSSTGMDGQVGTSGCNGGKYLQGWAPGGTETAFPADVGLQMPKGTSAFVGLEVHYDNSSNYRDAMDASGVEFCVTKTLRTNTASVHRLGSTSFTLPARMQSDVTNTCDPSTTQPVHLVAIRPQMNKLGTRARLVVNRSGGMRETLLDKMFALSDQQTYPSTALVNNGDTLVTTCSFDNTTSGTISAGNTMGDENCYNFVTAWPAGALSGFLTPDRCIGQ